MDPAYINVPAEATKALRILTSEFSSSLLQYSSLWDMATWLASMQTFLLVPKLHVTLATLTPSNCPTSAILEYVRGGGTLVCASMGDNVSLSTQSQLFEWNLGSADAARSAHTSLDADQAKGTNFAGDPATLPPLKAIRCFDGASRPNASRSIYYDGSAVSVFRAAVGAGYVIGLAPNWNETSSEGNSVLMAALQTAPGCEIGFKVGTYSNGSGDAHSVGRPYA
jgi:hypothetical protein